MVGERRAGSGGVMVRQRAIQMAACFAVNPPRSRQLLYGTLRPAGSSCTQEAQNRIHVSARAVRHWR